MLEKNHLPTIDNLFVAIEEKIITINNCLEEDLLSRKRYRSCSKKKFS